MRKKAMNDVELGKLVKRLVKKSEIPAKSIQDFAEEWKGELNKIPSSITDKAGRFKWIVNKLKGLCVTLQYENEGDSSDGGEE